MVFLPVWRVRACPSYGFTLLIHEGFALIRCGLLLGL
jgi:hypothetical protein